MKSKQFMPILLISLILIAGCTSQQEMTGQGTEEEYCVKEGTGFNMSFAEAKQIAESSECVEQGTLKDTRMCNEVTGTWWIDLNIQKQGCAPACVVNVETREAVINWRCTGLLT